MGIRNVGISLRKPGPEIVKEMARVHHQNSAPPTVDADIRRGALERTVPRWKGGEHHHGVRPTGGSSHDRGRRQPIRTITTRISVKWIGEPIFGNVLEHSFDRTQDAHVQLRLRGSPSTNHRVV